MYLRLRAIPIIFLLRALCWPTSHLVTNGFPPSSPGEKYTVSNALLVSIREIIGAVGDVSGVTGDEFKIVCEELWVDFKSWVTHHENMKNCITETNNTIRKNLATIVFIFVFLIGFRWYIGGGKEACAKFSMGGVVLNFVCEVFRYVGEAVLGISLGIIGFCVGIMPLVVCVCVFEFKDAFPDPIDLTELTNPTNHLKKD